MPDLAPVGARDQRNGYLSKRTFWGDQPLARFLRFQRPWQLVDALVLESRQVIYVRRTANRNIFIKI